MFWGNRCVIIENLFLYFFMPSVFPAVGNMVFNSSIEVIQNEKLVILNRNKTCAFLFIVENWNFQGVFTPTGSITQKPRLRSFTTARSKKAGRFQSNSD